MQEDVVLLIPKCSAMEISNCNDPLSSAKVMHGKDGGVEVTDELICSKVVPGGCPRVRCMKVGSGYAPCRMIGHIQSQENESGFWMKLPCSICPEKRKLSPTTEGFVHGS